MIFLNHFTINKLYLLKSSLTLYTPRRDKKNESLKDVICQLFLSKAVLSQSPRRCGHGENITLFGLGIQPHACYVYAKYQPYKAIYVPNYNCHIRLTNGEHSYTDTHTHTVDYFREFLTCEVTASWMGPLLLPSQNLPMSFITRLDSD